MSQNDRTLTSRYEWKYFVPASLLPSIRAMVRPFIRPDHFARQHPDCLRQRYIGAFADVFVARFPKTLIERCVEVVRYATHAARADGLAARLFEHIKDFACGADCWR